MKEKVNGEQIGNRSDKNWIGSLFLFFFSKRKDETTIWITPGLAEEDKPLFNTYFVDWFGCHFDNDKFAKSINTTFVRARLS